MKTALTNTEKSVLFRQRNKEIGRTEMRGIMATDAEQKVLKKICRDKLTSMRKDSQWLSRARARKVENENLINKTNFRRKKMKTIKNSINKLSLSQMITNSSIYYNESFKSRLNRQANKIPPARCIRHYKNGGEITNYIAI